MKAVGRGVAYSCIEKNVVVLVVGVVVAAVAGLVRGLVVGMNLDVTLFVLEADMEVVAAIVGLGLRSSQWRARRNRAGAQRILVPSALCKIPVE